MIRQTAGGGAFDLTILEPSLIERVEIVRGAASPIFGADALSGVVNFITRRAESEPRTRMGASYGSDDSLNLSLSHARPVGQASDIILAAGYAEGGNSVEGNSLRRLNLHLGGGSEITEKLKVRFGLFYADIEAGSFPEDSGGPRLALLRELQTRDGEFLSGYVKSQFRVSENFELNATYNMSRIEETIFSPAIAPGVLDGVPPFTSISDFERDEFILNGLYQFSSHVTVNLGAAYMREEGADNGFVDFGVIIPTEFSLKRHTKSLFAEIRLKAPGACRVTASGRLDDPDSLGAEMTFKASGECDISATNSLIFASWGEGFKLPSFFALGNPLVGNPDLRPERSTNYELGLRQTFWDRKAVVDVRYYKNSFTDLVDFDVETFRNVNRSEVKAEGIELSLQLLPTPVFELNMGLGFMETDIVGSDLQLRHRPKWKASAGLVWKASEDLRINVSAFFSGRFYDSSIVTGNVAMQPYENVDISALYKIRTASFLKLSIRNILGSKREELIGVPSPGRIAKLAFEHQF